MCKLQFIILFSWLPFSAACQEDTLLLLTNRWYTLANIDQLDFQNTIHLNRVPLDKTEHCFYIELFTNGDLQYSGAIESNPNDGIIDGILVGMKQAWSFQQGKLNLFGKTYQIDIMNEQDLLIHRF